MHLTHAIQQTDGLQFVTESLNILSPAGRRVLLALPFLTRADEIRTALDETEAVRVKITDPANEKIFSLLDAKLMQLRDIAGTIKHLANGNILNDIELFEIKHFALLATQIDETAELLQLPFFEIPDLTAALDLLDPEGKRIPHFYICDQFSDALAQLRKMITYNTRQGYDEKEIEPLRFRAQQQEDDIRQNLSRQLRAHAATLAAALDKTARLDLLVAKARQAVGLSLCKPTVSDGETRFTGLFHPQVRAALQEQGKDFQPVDIAIPMQPTVITGANMAGKSVLLKSVALAQTLFQFGFFVPARTAEIVPVQKIMLCAGDGEDQLSGLSSFAAEMLRLNAVAQNAEQGVPQLVLLDELARTTNPAEGKAIVCGVLDFLLQHRVRSLITTHYGIQTPCRKLRVKGFTESTDGTKIGIGNINDHIDYSLEETTDDHPPREALRIAEIIGVDGRLMEKIKNALDS